MKTKTIKKLLFGFIATMLFISCNKEDNEIEVRQLDPVKDKAIAEAIAAQNDKGIPFPEGSKVFKKGDGMFNIVLPKNVYYLIAKDVKSKEYIKVPEISVHCTCTDGTGCGPLKVNGVYYCVVEPTCKTCDRRVYANSRRVELIGLINLNDEVSFINKTDKKEYKCMKSEVLKLPEIKEGIEKFYLKIYKGNIPAFIKENKTISSKEYGYAKVNVFGYVMALPVLLNSINYNTSREIEIISKITCDCDWGTGCVKKKAFGGIYCESGPDCAACTMYDN